MKIGIDDFVFDGHGDRNGMTKLNFSDLILSRDDDIVLLILR